MNIIQSKPLISFLIPIYNVEPYLIECLDSVFKQVDNDAEIIVYEDCSTDKSKQLLLDYRKQHPSLIIYEGIINQGLSEARNILLREASGQYIWFLDSDDILETSAYIKVKNILEQESIDVVIGNFTKFSVKKNKNFLTNAFSGEKNKKVENIDFKALSNLLLHNKNYVWNKIFKKELIENKIIFCKGRNFEDIFFAPKLMMLIKNYYYLDESIVQYRLRENSLSSNSKLEGFIDISYSWRTCLDFYIQFGSEQDDLYIEMLYKIIRAYTGAVKELYKNNTQNKLTQHLEITEYLTQILPLSIAQIKKIMLKKLWLIRWYRFTKCLPYKV